MIPEAETAVAVVRPAPNPVLTKAKRHSAGRLQHLFSSRGQSKKVCGVNSALLTVKPIEAIAMAFCSNCPVLRPSLGHWEMPGGSALSGSDRDQILRVDPAIDEIVAPGPLDRIA